MRSPRTWTRGAPIRAGRGCSAARSLRGDRGAPHRAAGQRGLARPADDHAHPHVRDPAAGRVGHDLPGLPRPQDDLRRLPGGPCARRGGQAVPLRGSRPSRPAAARRARPHAARVHGRRQQHDRQRARHPRLRGRRARARRAALRRRRPRLRRHRRARPGRVAARTARAATASSATATRPTTTSCSSAGFSKAYSSLLAFIACPTEVKDLLKVAAPPYLYSGPSPVASLASVLVGFDVNERRGDELRSVLHARTARVLDCLHRLGRPYAEPLGLPDRRDPAARPPAHRRGRPAAVRPRRLRDARGLPARPARRGRLPRPADRRQHRRRDRHC